MGHSQELWFWEKTAETYSSSVSTLDSSLPISKLKWFSNLVFDVPQLWSPRSHGNEPARDSIFGGWGARVTSALGVLPLLQAASDSAGLGRPIVENTATTGFKKQRVFILQWDLLKNVSGEGNDKPFPVFLPGESHGQKSLAGYNPWGHKSWTQPPPPLKNDNVWNWQSKTS